MVFQIFKKNVFKKSHDEKWTTLSNDAGVSFIWDILELSIRFIVEEVKVVLLLQDFLDVDLEK